MLREISIEIIRKCPNNCLHCSSVSSENCSEMIPFEKFKEVVTDAKQLGLQTVCLSGGEPLLHPDITKIIRFLHGERLSSYIYTSGVCMDEKGMRRPIPEEMLEEFTGTATKLIFNIEAADENIYNAIMGTNGCFPILQESIRRSVAKGILVEGHFVPNKSNLNQIRKTLEMCQNLGVFRLSFLRLVLHGRAVQNRNKLELNDVELKEASELLRQIQTEGEYPIRIGVPLLGNTAEHWCEAAAGKINIRYDGRVYPCEVFKGDGIRALDGVESKSIFEEGITEIYRFSEYFKRVREMVRKFSEGPHCENCVGQYYQRKIL